MTRLLYENTIERDFLAKQFSLSLLFLTLFFASSTNDLLTQFLPPRVRGAGEFIQMPINSKGLIDAKHPTASRLFFRPLYVSHSRLCHSSCTTLLYIR